MEENAKSDGVWIVAEAHAGHVRPVAHELLARGRALADARRVPLVAVVLGADVSEEDLRELVERGADIVRHAAHPGLAEFLPQPYARVFEGLLQRHRPEIVLAAATTLGRTLLPYVAAHVRAGLTADCTQLDIAPDTGRLLQTRPAIGGNILATIETPTARPQMATVRPHSGPAAPRCPGRAGRIVREAVDPALLGGGVRFVRHVAAADAANLGDARIVVAGGRGFRTAERFQQVQALARALGGAVGASRDAVDRGWIA